MHAPRLFFRFTQIIAAGALAIALLATPLRAADGDNPRPKSKPAKKNQAAILVGAGDIADCNRTGSRQTAALLDKIPGTIFTAGDNAYPTGRDTDFRDCFEPTWGRHKDRTRPLPGNHDYKTKDAAAYFRYFGPASGDPARGYYSYDLGRWHIVMLNSNCKAVGGCGPTSPQVRWLRADLQANPSPCTLAIWHHPRYSSGYHGNEKDMQVFWDVLHSHGAELVVNGHDHDYERFAPMNPQGQVDTQSGLRQFVVGTGGAGLRRFYRIKANSEVRNRNTWGVLKLSLFPDRYEWEFVPVAGATFTDSGSSPCH